MLIKLIEKEFGLAQSTIKAIVATAPHRYKEYPVYKKNSSETRTIAQPAKEVKLLQRFIVIKILNELPIHNAAMAYMPGIGIRKNAATHVRNNFLLKMDFKDFFPSLTPLDLEKHIEDYLPNKFSSDDLHVIRQVCFWQPRKFDTLRLSIGGPSSPFISNTLMHKFDLRVSQIADEKRVAYTRYADDLTFSTNEPEVLRNIQKSVLETIRSIAYPRLTINEKKTIHTSKKHNRHVTGLVLSSQGNVSLGRDRKRQISAMVHHAAYGDLDPLTTERIKGLLAFAYDVEPLFLERLKMKYGNEHIDKLFQGLNSKE